MATYKDHLVMSNPTAAWMLDSNTSTEQSIGIGGLVANVSVADRVSNPIVSGAARAFTISQESIIRYPNLNIWSAGEHKTSFSVEFVVRPVATPSPVTIMAPATTSGLPRDNGIFITNNKISFVVSNSTPTENGSLRHEAYSYLDFSGETYHIVATYTPSSLSIFVDGELVGNVNVAEGFQWIHENDQTYGLETLGGGNSNVVLSGVAFYKGSLDLATIKTHFRAATLRSTPEEIVWSKSGTPFLINDSDRIKNFYFSEPLNSSWTDATLDNLSIENNKLVLDRIDPPELNGDPAWSSGLALSNTQFLKISDAGKVISSAAGAFGLFATYTSARQGALASGEYFIASLYNSDKSSVISIVEKSDKKIYLRYVSGTVASADALLASPSTSVTSSNYVYVAYDGSSVSAYWNDEFTTALIEPDQEAGQTMPKFDGNSTLIIGASDTEGSFWGSPVSWVNLWSSPRQISFMPEFKNDIYQYTLKLQSSLNVSQTGYASWTIDTGFDGATDTTNQSRVWWAPSAKGVSVSSSDQGAAVIPDEESIFPDIYVDHYESSISGFSSQDNMFPISEATAGFPPPDRIYCLVTLTTDDSVNDLVYLKKFGYDIFRDSAVIGEASHDELLFGPKPEIDFFSDNIGLQGHYHGAYIHNSDTACQIFSTQTTSPVTDNPDVPESSDSAPATELRMARTVEFFMNPTPISSGIVFIYSGTEAHTLSYNPSSRIFTLSGLDVLYVDGAAASLTGGVSTAYPSGFNDKWHLIHIGMNDVIDQTDDELFPLASGSVTSSLDETKFYSGHRSMKIAVGATAGFVSAYNSISGINTANGAKNTLSLMVHPGTNTSMRTNFRINSTDNIATHSGLTANQWNLVTRTFTNASTVTSLDVRIGTTSTFQTIWIDSTALNRGADPFIRFASSIPGAAWFGLDPAFPETQQATFRLQNVAVYNRSLTAAEILHTHKSYFSEPVQTLAPANSTNIFPGDLTSMASQPLPVKNRNPAASEEEMFQTNPILLSSAWQILSNN